MTGRSCCGSPTCTSERTDDGTYTENLGEANPAINCLDAGDDDAEASTLEEVQDSLPRFEKASPVFGRALAWGALSCTDWPIKALHPQADVDATGSKPIVVLGTTRDPATPYEWAKALTDQLGTAVLVTREGDGHTAYTSGNECIKRARRRLPRRRQGPQGRHHLQGVGRLRLSGWPRGAG